MTNDSLHSLSTRDIDPRLERVAAIILVLTPVLFLVALFSFFAAYPGADAPLAELYLSFGWRLTWVLATATYLAFSGASYLLIRRHLSGLVGHLLANVSLLLVPMVLLTLGTAVYASRALAGDRYPEIALGAEQLPLALRLNSAITDGLHLGLGIVYLFVIGVLGFVLFQQSGRWRAFGGLGVGLGAIGMLINFWHLFTGSFPLVPLVSTALISFWLVGAGWYFYRSARAGGADSRGRRGKTQTVD